MKVNQLSMANHQLTPINVTIFFIMQLR